MQYWFFSATSAKLSQEMAFKKKNGKTMSGFLKIRDFFKKSVLLKTAEFSVSDTGDPLILTCLWWVLLPILCLMTF